MQVFVARQAIYTKQRKVFAYELLFRSGLDNYFQCSNPDAATAQVLDNGHFVFGLNTLTAGTKAFVNFTRNTLLEEYAFLIPSQSLVVEVLEDVEPDDDIIQACRHLKDEGYRLALDDYVLLDGKHPLLPLVDIVKVDFAQLDDEQRREIPRQIGMRGITYLAEKVETEHDVDIGLEAGYALFQGYYFSKPTIVEGTKPDGFPVNHLRILEEVRRPSIDFNRLDNLIKREASLVYRVLRHVNSASNGLRYRVTSTKRSLLLMGEENIRRLISVLLLGDLYGDRPNEIIRTSATRACFCEAIAVAARWDDSASSFLLGLFSAIDVVMSTPMADVLADLPLPASVVDALLGRESPLQSLYHLMLACENGAWETVDTCAIELGIPKEDIAASYFHAVAWAQTALR